MFFSIKDLNMQALLVRENENETSQVFIVYLFVVIICS